jgi:NTE family protein
MHATRYLLLLLGACLAFSPRTAAQPDSVRRIVLRPLHEDHPGVLYRIVPEPPLERPRIGLVLSGGGARGLAQVGVLKALERAEIPIDMIIGTSMGAVVGGLYAAGWSAAEIESIALHTDWDEVLSLSEDTRRSDLFLDQKLAVDRSFLVIRFEGFTPVFPAAVASGQRLTNMLTDLTLQAVFHPNPSFDDLRIPFRAVATDLVSGARVVLDRGSLAEALRASTTVPLLFPPVEHDGAQLVDGGLVSNIPVDVARSAGCDIVVAVNTASELRDRGEMETPWETADQIMGIMMQQENRDQLEAADLVITPEIGRHLSTEFRGLDTLIAAGMAMGQRAVPYLLNLYQVDRAAMHGLDKPAAHEVLRNVSLRRTGDGITDAQWEEIRHDALSGVLTFGEIRKHLDRIYNEGNLQDLEAEVLIRGDSASVTYHGEFYPEVRSVEIRGATRISRDSLRAPFEALLGNPANNSTAGRAMEALIRLYRDQGYSLARIDSAVFDPPSGQLVLTLSEGIIGSVRVEGGVRTKDWFVLREFPLGPGDIFVIDQAREGIDNVNGLTLFESVSLEVSEGSKESDLTIRLQERPSRLMRLGLRADNERSIQGMVDLRDENYQGTGLQLGLTVAGGARNVDAALEFKAQRLFDTYLTFGIRLLGGRRDTYLYGDAPPQGENSWRRERIGEYAVSRLGGELTFGGQLERLGKVTASYMLQRVRLTNIDQAAGLEDRYWLGGMRLGTRLDTKDRYPFPTQGIGLEMFYTFTPEALGTTPGFGYNALMVSFESYTALSSALVFHPRVLLGFADKTMPLSEQYSLGGRESFFGLREDDSRGRQLLQANLEFRLRMPINLLFDTYLQGRYDLATISEVPEEIKLSTLRHALGIELALDTPIGGAFFGAGNAFFFSRDLPDNPLQLGPVLFYFSIGYEL